MKFIIIMIIYIYIYIKASFLPSLQLNSLLFADDFVGLCDSKEGLQDMINVVHA